MRRTRKLVPAASVKEQSPAKQADIAELEEILPIAQRQTGEHRKRRHRDVVCERHKAPVARIADPPFVPPPPAYRLLSSDICIRSGS